MQNEESNKKNIQKCLTLIQSGKLRPLVSKIYNFSNWRMAFDDMMNRRVTGKICVVPDSGLARL